MCCISKYLQKHYSTVYHESCTLFCLLQSNVPGTFFNMTHQVKAIAIAIVEANPLVKIVSVFLISSLYMYRTCIYANYIIKRGIHPHSASIIYCIQFSLWYQVPIETLKNFLFLVKIDHGNGTITGILSHLNTIYEWSNDHNLIYYRYRGNYTVLIAGLYIALLLNLRTPPPPVC